VNSRACEAHHRAATELPDKLRSSLTLSPIDATKFLARRLAPMRSNQGLRRRRKGLQIVGPGFYLWDLDAREAVRLAAELSRGPTLRPRLRRTPLRGPLA